MATLDEAFEVDVLVRDAIVLSSSGQRDEAIKQFESALAENPDHAFGRLHLAMALGAAERFDDAVTHLQRALDLRPDQPAFFLFAGRLYFDADDHDAAEKAFVRALELSPANDLIQGSLTLNRWAAGNEAAAFELAPDALPDSTPFLARVLLMLERGLEGRHVEFKTDTVAVRFLDRLHIGFALWRGSRQAKEGRFGDAATKADMVLEICPGHPGAVEFRRDCCESALSVARRKVEEHPDSPENRTELAAVLVEAEQYEAAYAQIEELERIAAEQEDVSLLEAKELQRLRARIAYGLGKIDTALEMTRAGMEPGFSMPETHYYLGLCHLRRNEKAAAIGAFESLVDKVCWAVPLRFKEYLAWRRSGDRPLAPSASET